MTPTGAATLAAERAAVGLPPLEADRGHWVIRALRGASLVADAALTFVGAVGLLVVGYWLGITR